MDYYCRCPIRCKGGRKVSKTTYNRHRKEREDEERERTLREIRHLFPGGVIPPPDALESTRRHRADSETQVAPRKKARRGDVQGSDTQMEQVGALMNFLG